MNWLDELEVEEERWKFAIKDRPNLIAKKEKEVSLKLQTYRVYKFWFNIIILHIPKKHGPL